MRCTLVFRKPISGKNLNDYELQALDSYVKSHPIEIPEGADDEEILDAEVASIIDQHPELNGWSIAFDWEE